MFGLRYAQNGDSRTAVSPFTEMEDGRTTRVKVVAGSEETLAAKTKLTPKSPAMFNTQTITTDMVMTGSVTIVMTSACK